MRLRQRSLSLLALGVTALLLAGCGRKSGLDLPPSAEAAPPAQAQTQSTMLPLQRPPKQKQPAPPKRDLPIDVLLN